MDGGDFSISTIEVDARSRNPPFGVVEVGFVETSFHFKELG